MYAIRSYYEKDPQIIAIGEVIRDLDDVLAVVTGLRNNWSRITSYNVCYTKLLRAILHRIRIIL